MPRGRNVIHHLADSDIAWEKLIPFGIFVVIWVGAAIASGVKKVSQQAAKSRQASMRTPTTSYPTATAIPRAAVRKPVSPLKSKRAGPARARLQGGKRPPIDRGQPAIVQQAEALARMFAPTPPPLARMVAPAPARVRVESYAPPQPVEVAQPLATVSAIEARTIEAQRVSDARSDSSSEGETSTGAAARGPKVTAKALSAWLRPPTLREQFILTEIFQPPIALRPHERIL